MDQFESLKRLRVFYVFFNLSKLSRYCLLGLRCANFWQVP